MDILESIKASLDENVNLSSEVKDNIFELVNILHTKLPDVDLSNFVEPLKTLQVKKLNKFISSEVSRYSHVENILYLNSEKLTDDYDGKHILMFELLNILTTKDGKRGFIEDGRFEALNVGFTEILANFLVGNECERSLYQEQAIETNLISIIIGSDVLKEAYFKNDTAILIKGFKDAGVEV